MVGTTVDEIGRLTKQQTLRGKQMNYETWKEYYEKHRNPYTIGTSFFIINAVFEELTRINEEIDGYEPTTGECVELLSYHLEKCSIGTLSQYPESDGLDTNKYRYFAMGHFNDVGLN